MRPALAEVAVGGDDPAPWARLGFTPAPGDGAVVLGPVAVVPGKPVALGFTGLPEGIALDGLPLRAPAARTGAGAVAEHPNGATVVDHVVVTTPALDRTLAALTGAGLELRATRDVPGERPLRQAFVLTASCLLEVVGPPGGDGHGTATVWGLTIAVPDVDTLARRHEALVGRPRDAVQAGRRIVTARPEAGLALPVAFITPRAPR